MAAKAAVAGLAAILVVAMVVAVAVGITKKHNEGESGSISAGSTKAVQSICAPTDYKDTCESSLSHSNTTDPKELIKAAFEFTEKNIGDAIKNSPLFKEAAQDDGTKQALAICQEVLDTAIDDLKRSFDKVGEFDASKANEYLEDLKTWLSAVITNHETCIDAFENTTGDTGEKMKELLQTARQMSSNGLAMVSNMSSIFTSLQGGSVASGRKLLSEEEADLFISNKQRSLMGLQANAVVAQDGSGQFKTISAAIASVPQKNNQTFVIHVKAGVYKEYVQIPKKVNKIVLIGDGPLKQELVGERTLLKVLRHSTLPLLLLMLTTSSQRTSDLKTQPVPWGIKPWPYASLAIVPSLQCPFDGYQDTLYAHTYRQYYRDCSISGTIDFIFGDAIALFQNCKFVVRKPGPNQACMVTAQGRVERHSLGVNVIQNGDFVAEPALLQAAPPIKVYLGRPWKQLSRTIIMQSNIGGFVAPEGWSVWQGTFALDTLYYAEYQNRGPRSI
ncbi:UNVERIFIED_CONTAM: putative pectinesterase/pectinesterase inhibitor 21 [Sesamum latifolium]|uniref:Pectinesterase n=1 Tax=Sesamum latifolium TaxID=2727402 RepID=A0AAW2VX65_9LAMI